MVIAGELINIDYIYGQYQKRKKDCVMNLTVKKALSLPVCEEIKVIAGKENLDHSIRWVHMGESANMASWLRGGELLLTCLHGVKNNKKVQEKFLRNLADKGVAAVGIEPGYYFETIPENMREVADNLKLPLLEIPQGQPFIEISERLINILLHDEEWLDYELPGDKPIDLQEKIDNDLCQALKNGETVIAHRIVREILKTLKSTMMPAGQLEFYLQEIIVVISRAAIELNADLDRVFKFKETIINHLNKLQEFSRKFDFIEAFVRDFISFLNRRHDYSDNSELGRAIKYLQHNYNRNISLPLLAEKVYVSESYLCKLFKNEIDKTIFELLTEIRMEEARRYLVNTDLTLAAIASRVGYNDVSYFSRVFKKREGIPPGQYRKMLTG